MKSNIDKVYAFEFCHCVYESSHEVISLHRSKTKAQRAMQKHKSKYINEEKRRMGDNNTHLHDSRHEAGWMCDWNVRPIQIQE